MTTLLTPRQRLACSTAASETTTLITPLRSSFARPGSTTLPSWCSERCRANQQEAYECKSRQNALWRGVCACCEHWGHRVLFGGFLTAACDRSLERRVGMDVLRVCVRSRAAGKGGTFGGGGVSGSLALWSCQGSTQLAEPEPEPDRRGCWNLEPVTSVVAVGVGTRGTWNLEPGVLFGLRSEH